jgi:ribosome maturation factor RimP
MAKVAQSTLVEKITEIARRACEREGIEVWDLAFVGGGRSRVLRIYIDKPSGVTHADCELISQQVGTVLDMENVIPGESYHLEVSSPGLERKLRGPADYERFTGQKARVVLKEPVENQKRWDGTLAGVRDGFVTIEASSGKSIRFRVDQIEKANLKFEW